LPDEEADVIDGDDAEIGQAHRRRHGGAREIQRVEARSLGLQGGEAIVRAGQTQNAVAPQQRAKTVSRRLGWRIGANEIGHVAPPLPLASPGVLLSRSPGV
jgi:hypothetical protein